MYGSFVADVVRIQTAGLVVIFVLLTIIGFCFGAAFGRSVAEKRLREEAIAHGALKVSYDPVTGEKSQTWNSR